MELPSFRPRRALAFFLPASALLFSFELASGSSFGLLELSVAGLSVSLLLSVWGQFGFRPVPIARFLSMAGTGGAPLCFAALFYLAADLLSVLYSPALRLMWEKYRVVAALLVVAAAVSFVRGDARLLRRTAWALAWSAPLIALATLTPFGSRSGGTITCMRPRFTPRRSWGFFCRSPNGRPRCAGRRGCCSSRRSRFR